MATGAPVRLSKARTASMSATQSVSAMMAIPLGAWSVTPPRPPAMNLRESIVRSGRTRLMKPLSSLAAGSPLMLETKKTSVAES